jgi:prepilin-type processing-associated H-X9-DG protein
VPPIRRVGAAASADHGLTQRLEEFGVQKGPVMSFFNRRVGKTLKLASGIQMVFKVDASNALNQNSGQITNYAFLDGAVR